MKTFPFFGKIEGKTFLIVGGGRVAAEKVTRLLPFADRLHVVGLWVSDEIRQMARSEGVSESDKKASAREAAEEKGKADGPQVWIEERAFEERDLNDADYCIAATDDYEVNRKIHDLCVERKIPVNVVDTMELCEFIFPSLITRGDLTIAVSTNGKSPAMARYLKKQIESVLPEETEAMLNRLGNLRSVLPKYISTQKQRGTAYKEIMELLLATDNKATDTEIETIIKKYAI